MPEKTSRSKRCAATCFRCVVASFRFVVLISLCCANFVVLCWDLFPLCCANFVVLC